MQTLTESRMIVNLIHTELNAPTNSTCNMVGKNEQAYLLHLHQSRTRAKILQVTSDSIFSARFMWNT